MNRLCIVLGSMLLAVASVRGADLTKLYASPKLDSAALTLQQKKGDNAVGLSMLTPDGRDEGGNNKARDFGKIQVAGTSQFSVLPIITGVLIETDAGQLDCFTGMKPPPQYVAFSSGGKVVVRSGAEKIALDTLDAPWLLCWWGDKTPHARFGASHEPRTEFDFPFLIVLQNPASSAAIEADRLTPTFPGKAGSVAIMPLQGQLSVSFEKAAKAAKDAKGQPIFQTTTRMWVDGLPEEVVGRVRDWTARLRHIPVEVATTYEVKEDGVHFTEKFTHRKIEDAWKTAGRPWALLPPPIAFAKFMKGPVVVQGETKDLPWLGSSGSLTVADGAESVSYTLRIPQLNDYVFKEHDGSNQLPDNPQVKNLRAELTREIDKILAQQDSIFKDDPKGKPSPLTASPARLFLVLSAAVPLLPKDKAERLKAFLQARFQGQNPLKDPKARLEVLAGTWAYAKHVGSETESKALWPQVKPLMDRELSAYPWSQVERPETNDDGLAGQSLLGRLNGHVACARFARQAGDKESEALALCMCARALVLKYALAHYFQYLIDRDLERGTLESFPPKFFGADERIKGTELAVHREAGWYMGNGTYNGTFRPRVSYAFFRDLTPESGQFLHDYCRGPVEAAVRYSYWLYPGQWMSKTAGFHRTGEHLLAQPWTPWAGFMARALVLQDAPADLYEIAGDPYYELGDLYYIQRLSTALAAFASAKPK